MVDNFSELLSNTQNKAKMNRSGVSLNSEQKMRLIEAIHERPQIWDSSYEGFRSNPTRQGAFNEVAELLSDGSPDVFTRIQVQEEWGKLRYCFTRIIKKLYDEGCIGPDGTISQQNQDHQLITWPYWQPMSFLLEGVVLQLCSTRGGSNYSGDDGCIVGDNFTHNKASTRQNSEELDNHKNRRTRRSMRGGLSSAIHSLKSGRKGNNSYLAIEEDILNTKNQSTNDLLMSNLLNSFAPHDLLLSNLSALNEQFQPHKVDDDTEEIVIDNNLTNIIEEKEDKNNNGFQQNDNKFDGHDGEIVNENLRGKRKRKKEEVYADSLNELDALFKQRIEANDNQFNGHNRQHNQQRSFSPAPLEPSSTTKKIISNIKQVNSLNGSDGGTICGGSVVNGNVGGGTIDDVNESFGRCIVHQLQMVAKKDSLLCVQMRKKLLDVCFEYEIEACKISKTEE